MTFPDNMLESGRGRFDRCLTPMGTVPISVIYGFQYPGGKRSPAPASQSPQSPASPPARGAGQQVPVWPSCLASPLQQSPARRNVKIVEPPRTLSVAPARSPPPPSRTLSVAPTRSPVPPSRTVSVAPAPQPRTFYQSSATLRSRELPKRSYLSSWRESVRSSLSLSRQADSCDWWCLDWFEYLSFLTKKITFRFKLLA